MKNIVLVHGGFVDGAGWEGVYKIPTCTHRPPFNVAAQSAVANAYYHIIPWTVPLGPGG